MSAGAAFPSGVNASVGVGYQVIPTAPKRFIYVSGQGGLILAGFSVGTILYEHDAKNYRGIRTGIWGGAGLLGSWERYQFPELGTTMKSIGLWGKFPIPLSGVPGFSGV